MGLPEFIEDGIVDRLADNHVISRINGIIIINIIVIKTIKGIAIDDGCVFWNDGQVHLFDGKQAADVVKIEIVEQGCIDRI